MENYFLPNCFFLENFGTAAPIRMLAWEAHQNRIKIKFHLLSLCADASERVIVGYFDCCGAADCVVLRNTAGVHWSGCHQKEGVLPRVMLLAAETTFLGGFSLIASGQ